ncbi:hypothetical protein [Priestia flexa]|uniref:hypothetical protein n=1 Tax=Priestia flexa TaxID=86664 RepID=UPI001B33DC04|nr:hypothetical protein [Priestia flexa]
MTYLVAYTNIENMEYSQVTCRNQAEAEQEALRLEKEGHLHIEIISNQEAYDGDESSFRE